MEGGDIRVQKQPLSFCFVNIIIHYFWENATIYCKKI